MLKLLLGCWTVFGVAAAAQAGNLNFNGGAVSACTLAGSNYSCGTLDMPNNTDILSIASGYAVTVAAGSFTFNFNQGLRMSGSAALTVNGSLDIGNINPANLSISGGELTAKGGTFSMGAQTQTMVANVTAAAIKIGTGTASKVTGNLSASGNIDIASHASVVGAISGANVTTAAPATLSGDVNASGVFTLASGSTLSGDVTAATINIKASSSTVTGDLTASGTLTVGSGNTVNGNLVAPTVSIDPSNVNVNGNVTASTSLSLGSGDTIGGDVVAGNVTLASSDAAIAGNARVNALTLGWHGRVLKNIVCNNYSAGDPCDCVTNNSGYDAASTPKGPSCAAPPTAGPHHIRISQPGAALTCQAQTVTLTACANAACTAPHFAGQPRVTLTPGGAAFNIDAGGVNGGATVRQTTPGTASLAASSVPAALNAATCVNTANPGAARPCDMLFAASGLTLAVPNHRADSAAAFSVSALQAAPNGQACVPLFAGTSKSIDFGCAYANPATGARHVRVGSAANGVPADTAGACAARLGSVTLNFDANGVAGAWLKYADVGRITVTASYAPSSGADQGLVMSGSASAVVAPAAFAFERIWDAAAPVKDNPAAAAAQGRAGPVFIKAGKPFSAQLSARNSSNAVTPNFGAETPPQTVTLNQALQYPGGGRAGTLSGGFGAPFAAGVGVASDLAWDEVGILTLTATGNADGYLGAPGAQTRDAAGALLAVGGASGNVGRFIPDHFNTVVLSGKATPAYTPATPGVPMDCVAGLSCAGAQNGFAYAGQDFALRVLAMNANNVVTENYSGAADPQLSIVPPLRLTGWTQAGGNAQNPAGDANYAAAGGVALPAVSFVKGQSSTLQAYAYPLVPGLPSDVFFRASESGGDGVTSLRPANSAEDGLSIVSGRMLIPNNYGSELLPMTINLRAQYRNAAGVWLPNGADSASVVTPAALSRSNCVKNLLDASKPSGCKDALAVATPGSVTFSQGAARFQLRAPGAGNNGSALLQFLKESNPSSKYLPSAKGQATFGLYRAGPVIYLRELY
ncbi:DUF6701 domain-containing protein [Janthinobacterium sp.]|uniref:DUF6701 domain-containing protein n=1 Tax=Janthinobacterium sp. TaxID=1871054 RepID=UPI00293D498A|nr:DUF6701 domain-containing protein [Janthinobacterium sp.]